VRLFTRNGHDWTDRYPLILEAALRNRQTSFVIDGEAVLLGVDGISDFNGLHSRRHNDEVQLYAFDILALGGEDLRKLPLHLARTTLQGCWRSGRMGFSSANMSKARSARTCSGKPANSASRGWYQNTRTGHTATDGRRTGSR
jgi:ATP-dependent DNA ligase